MKRQLLLAAPMALLFACSGSAVSLQPGQWETTVRFSDIQAPGAPEAMLVPMRAAMSQPQVNSQCMTPAQAANPAASLANPGGGGACQYSESTFAGGRIKVRGTCQGAGPGAVSMSMEGSYTATTMQAQVSSEMQMPQGQPGPRSIRMSGTLSGRRTGECTSG